MIRHVLISLFFLCLALTVAEAQTPTSITITPSGPIILKTGAFASLSATDNNGNPIFVNWTSSNPAAVSVDQASGTITGISGTVLPVTITATSGTLSQTITVSSVTPQTALYAVDGNNNLYVYDNTQALISNAIQLCLGPAAVLGDSRVASRD